MSLNALNLVCDVLVCDPSAGMRALQCVSAAQVLQLLCTVVAAVGCAEVAFLALVECGLQGHEGVSLLCLRILHEANQGECSLPKHFTCA
jgi:hypothetical protein